MENTGKSPLHLWLSVLVYLGFVSIGLPDGLLGVAWPAMRGTFGLPLAALGSLLVMYTVGYLLASFSSGWLLAHLSVGMVLALSCLATGISLLGYAVAGPWWLVLLLGTLAGLGAGAIDAGLNTYAASHFSARMVNWLHACYGIGALSGPLLMTSVLARGQGWQFGYAIVGAGQVALAGSFAWTSQQWNGRNRTAEKSAMQTGVAASSFSTLRLPGVWLSLAIFFVYTGIEAAAGTWAFSLFTEARGVAMKTAGMWVSIYWGGLTAGRVVAAWLGGRVPVHKLLRGCVALQALGVTLWWWQLTNLSSFLGLALLGLASAPIFPTLIATTPGRVGEAHLANSVGFQIAAAVLGQSLLPALLGLLAHRFGLELLAPALLVAVLLLFVLLEVLPARRWKRLRTTETLA